MTHFSRLIHQNQLKLLKLFEIYIQGERLVEDCRLALAKEINFDALNGFQKIDSYNVGYITNTDLFKFLRDNGLPINNYDIAYIIKEYDSNKDGMLSYNDYLSIILPKSNIVLRNICSDRRLSPKSSSNGKIPYHSEYLLAKLFENEINLLKQIDVIKEDLSATESFIPNDMYNMLIDENIEGITQLKFKEFFAANGINLKDDELKTLILRLDKDNDGKICYEEFIEIVLTKTHISKILRNNDDIKQKLKSPLLQRSNFDLSFRDSFSTIDKTYDFMGKSKSPYRMDDDSYIDRSALNNTKFSYNKNDTMGDDKMTESYRQYKELNRSLTPNKTSINKKSPIKGKEGEYLAIILKNQLELDKNLEIIRQELALRTDFNLMDAFRFFDQIGRGFVNLIEFKEALENFDVYANHQESSLIIKRYDSRGDNLLRFNDFCGMITPRDPEIAKAMKKRPPTYVNDDYLTEVIHNLFSKETQQILRSLFNQIIINEVEAENLRKRLAKLFNTIDAFRALDTTNKGYATVDDVKVLLESNGYKSSTVDIFTLLRRYDKNDTGKITITNFIQEITPKYPIKQQYLVVFEQNL